MNKRGFIQDSVYFVVILFMIALATVIFFVVSDNINDAFQEETSISDTSKEHFDDFNTKFTTSMDWTFVLILLGIVIAGLIVSYVVPSNPLIFFFLVFIVTILGAGAGFLSNAWDDATTDGGEVEASASNFPMTSFVMDNYMLFLVVIIFLMGVVFYAKPEGAL